MNAVPTPPRMDIASEIDSVSALIAGARAEIAAGRQVDLRPIDGRVESVCAEIKHARPGNRAAIRSALENLIRDLDSLEAELTAQFRTFDVAPNPPAPERAANAYKKR